MAIASPYIQQPGQGGGSSTTGRNVAFFNGNAQHFRTSGLLWQTTDTDAANRGRSFWIWRGGNTGGGYVFSDSAAGDHTMLCGYVGGVVSGNLVLDGTPFSFNGGCPNPSCGAVLYDNDAGGSLGIKTVNVFAEGVLDGSFVVAGAGVSTCPSGHGQGFIGGSDHSNFVGWLAWLAFWQGTFPYSSPWVAIVPPGMSPCDFGIHDAPSGLARAAAVWDWGNCPVGSALVPDTSSVGYQGRRNPAFAENSTGLPGATVGWSPNPQDVIGYSTQQGSSTPVLGQPIPIIGQQPLYSTGNGYLVVPSETLSIPSAPNVGGATLLASDSFTRPNQTYAFQQRLTIGKPEYGTLSGQSWRSERAGWNTNSSAKPDQWGIIGGPLGKKYVVNMDDQGMQLLTLDTGLTDYSISFSRDVDARWPGGAAVAGCVFRYVDNQSYYYVFIDPRPSPMGSNNAGMYTFGYWLNGTQHPIANYVPSSSIASKKTVLVVVSGNSANIYFDGTFDRTLDISAANSTGRRAGPMSWSWGGDTYTTSGVRITDVILTSP